MRQSTIALVIATQLLAGCASIVGGTMQSVSVKTLDGPKEVSGSKCSLTNGKGQWFTTSPGSVVVQRSFSDLFVQCKPPAGPTGEASVKSTTRAIAFGNILIGGVIGAGVDIGTGAAFYYPEVIEVQVGRPGEPASTSSAPSAAVTSGAGSDTSSTSTPTAASTARGGPDPDRTPAKDRWVAERKAREMGCTTEAAARLVEKSAGLELFELRCNDGSTLRLACEWGNCRTAAR